MFPEGAGPYVDLDEGGPKFRTGRESKTPANAKLANVSLETLEGLFANINAHRYSRFAAFRANDTYS